MNETDNYNKSDEKFMREAIKQAKKAYALGEVPMGWVITCIFFHARTLPNVLWCDCAGTDIQSGYGVHECKSRVRRVNIKPFAAASV